MKIQSKKTKLLSGGNPQVAKGDGDAVVQSFIDACPGWKQEACAAIDALIVQAVPKVQKAVRWNSPFYGVEGRGWFLSYHCMSKYIKVTFFRGRSLDPMPPEGSKDPEARYFHLHEQSFLENSWEKQKLIRWIKQASKIDGWDGKSGNSRNTPNRKPVKQIKFTATLLRLTDEAEYFGLTVPTQITRELGTLAAVPVSARINAGSPYETSLYPLGEGRHGMRLKAAVRKEAEIHEGDQVEVSLQIKERDERSVIPTDLKQALSEAGVLDTFKAMPPGMMNFLIRQVEEVAREETRKKRIQSAVDAASVRYEKNLSRPKK